MYLIAITVGLCISYFILFFLLPVLFEKKRPKISRKSLFSIAMIILFSFAGYAVVFSISDPEVSNRFLHAFGGGFMTLFVCFRVVRDSELPITMFQFFSISALIATALGVANELLEFFLQYYFGLISSATPTDTWLDLLSNTVGILVASLCLVPFIHRRNTSAHEK